jgi:hypothetical protein
VVVKYSYRVMSIVAGGWQVGHTVLYCMYSTLEAGWFGSANSDGWMLPLFSMSCPLHRSYVQQSDAYVLYIHTSIDPYPPIPPIAKI